MKEKGLPSLYVFKMDVSRENGLRLVILFAVC